jgi:[ribosomal protein S5]-alanine N-acetyltransferase
MMHFPADIPYREKMSLAIPTLATPRLLLRPLVLLDAYALHQIYQIDGVLSYFPNQEPPSLEEVHQFIRNQARHWEEHGYGNWGLVLKDSAELIGWAGPQFLPETGETEIGYLLARPFWGYGYATEAARASLEFVSENFDFPEIIALVHPENTASRHVVEKCGMTLLDRKIYFGMEMCRYLIKHPTVN